MSLLTYLRRQFEHDTWANREQLAMLSALDRPPEYTLKLLGHIVASEWLWLDRLQETQQRSAVWAEASLDEYDDQLQQLSEAWRTYLDQLSDDDLDRGCTYTNSKGEVFTSKVIDVLTHVTLHSSHHRGQIALEIRRGGQVPVITDYIHAVRQGLVTLTCCWLPLFVSIELY